MADDPKSANKPAKKKAPVDRANTLLFRFARGLGRTARVFKIGSTWFLKKSGPATPKAAKKKGAKVEEEATAEITADVEAAVRAAEEGQDEEQAAQEVTADVEAALKAAEESSKE